jgi:hypothetical protein
MGRILVEEILRFAQDDVSGFFPQAQRPRCCQGLGMTWLKATVIGLRSGYAACKAD